MSRLMLTGDRRGAGTTTMAVGLSACLSARGTIAVAAVGGPGPGAGPWLSLAAGRRALQLDPGGDGRASVRERAASLPSDAVLLVDGAVPLPDDTGVGAAHETLERMLGAPTVLVIDAQGLGRGLSAFLLGLRRIVPDRQPDALLLNRVSSPRQEDLLRRAVSEVDGPPVLGAVAELPWLDDPWRGLPFGGGAPEAAGLVARLQTAMAGAVDTGALHRLAQSARPLPPFLKAAPPVPGPRLRIGLLRDEAFGLLYEQDLARLEGLGAQLVNIDSLGDAHPPSSLDGLLIGHGAPQPHLDTLEANAALRGYLRTLAEAGLPILAFGHGLLYLCRSVRPPGGRERVMTGILPLEASLLDRPPAIGPVRLKAMPGGPWQLGAVGDIVGGYQDHRLRISGGERDVVSLYRVVEGFGLDGRVDGLARGNVMAFASLVSGGPACPWPERFLTFVEARRKGGR